MPRFLNKDLKKIGVEITAEDNTKQGVASATRNLKGLESALGGISSGLGIINKAQIGLGVGIAATSGLALRSYAALEKEAAAVGTLFTGTRESIDARMEKVIETSKRLSYTNQQTATDFVKDFYNVQSGLASQVSSIEGQEKILASSALLAAAGRGTLTDSTYALITATNAWNLGADEAEKSAANMFNTIRQGVLTLPDLTNVLNYMGGTAAQAGVEMEQALTLTAAATTAGFDIQRVGSALNSIIADSISGNKRMQDLLKTMGLTNKEWKEIIDEDAIGAYSRLFDEMTKSGVEAGVLFGKEYGSLFAALFQPENRDYLKEIFGTFGTGNVENLKQACLLYTSPSPRDS